MRRSALHLGIPVVCALLGVTLIGASGRADDTDRLPEIAMAVSATPTTRPAAVPTELLVSHRAGEGRAGRRDAPTASPARGPRIVMMEVTAYCPCKKCCGPKAQGITASGKRRHLQRRRCSSPPTRKSRRSARS